ncbi:hypothetical protein GCM10017691_47450 [Pseudonocardia petroleophila]|uniref:Glycosyl transferase family 2 n=1 Tax=Pseudonocardia petroleophila TaxID=37331 RepID=A0A7G7MQK3_9PSEU|nr:hypothetical protein [Pseudonocardia petroleophila]QNG55064.1 hypothetical protein H6H00_15060 [Pseudonocardia petroleophila]
MTTTPRPLRVLHRSYGGDNTKPRPPYYSKLLALAALLRAADALDVAPELVFINDGHMPQERLSVMERFGEVVSVRKGGSDTNSYREMLADENARSGDPNDLIWLAEDDYLYVPDALRQLVAGSAALPDADYFTLYGARAIDVARSRRKAVIRPEPAAEGTGQVVEVGEVAWYRAASTTSTFGITRRALNEDVRLLRHFSLTGGAWDSATCKAIQGLAPFSAKHLRRDFLPFREVPPALWPKSYVRGALRVASIPLSVRSPQRRRALLGSDPELIIHMEAPDDPPRALSARTQKIDWAAVATETAEWGNDHGIPVVIPSAAGGTS